MVNPEASIELAVDLVWLRGFNITHFIVIVVFYLLWRLPGPKNKESSDAAVVWYDAVERLPVESDVSDDDDDDDDSSNIQHISYEDDSFLLAQVKESTAAERLRFLVGKSRHRVRAAQALRTYTDWRLAHQVPLKTFTTTTSNNNNNTSNLSEDEKIWNEASLIALQVRQERNCHQPLPKIAHLHQTCQGQDMTDKTGKRILHFIPGRMDDRIASTVTYALAVALYVDRLLDRESTELVTVVIDARGGYGWRNLNAAQLLPFIQHLSKLMLTMHPQRLYRALVFPIPSRFFWVWRMARNCLDPATRDKICPLMGPSTIDSEPPMNAIAEYLGRENALLLEAKRKSGFMTASPPSC